MSSFIYYLFGWEEEVKEDPLKDKQKHQKYLTCKSIQQGVKLNKTSLLSNLLKNQKKGDSERKLYAKTYADVLFQETPKKRKPSKIISGSNFHSIL